MRSPFLHPELRVFRFEEVPLNRDIYLMGEKWMRRYESALLALLNGKNYKNVGYISYAAARAVGAKSLELSLGIPTSLIVFMKLQSDSLRKPSLRAWNAQTMTRSRGSL